MRPPVPPVISYADDLAAKRASSRCAVVNAWIKII
jgi:hypothetical protein